ncbi:DUF4355 domain-containing protein [Staphylococcus haemolyticus]|uniref:DUF4355 domain-containing protein n=1 Tax=Staphylococcus haemolyticus TaxID=1283 RepID=UPI0031016295
MTELRRRLNQAFLSSSHPCRVETTNLKEFCPTPIQEAEKLAKTNKDQKSQYEIEKLLKENEALKAEKALSQMRNETRSMLSESGVENFDDQIVDIIGKP